MASEMPVHLFVGRVISKFGNQSAALEDKKGLTVFSFQITSQNCDITFGLGTPLCKPDKNDKIHRLFYWTNGNLL